MKDFIIQTRRPVDVSVVVGFILLFAVMAISGYSIPENTFTTLVCILVPGAIWALVGIILSTSQSRKLREVSMTPAERKANQTKFAVSPLIVTIISLIAGHYIFTVIFAIGTVVAWYDRQRM